MKKRKICYICGKKRYENLLIPTVLRLAEVRDKKIFICDEHLSDYKLLNYIQLLNINK